MTGGIIEELGGSWVRPTVITDIDHSMLLMRKETFAPIAPIMTFKNSSEAISLANDSEYGLSAAVFGELDKSEAVALNLNGGGIYCNDIDLIGSAHDSAEKMSFNNSGLGGLRYNPEGITRFTRTIGGVLTRQGYVDRKLIESSQDRLNGIRFTIVPTEHCT